MQTAAVLSATAARPLAVALVTETWPPEVNGVAMTLSRLVDGLLRRGHRVQLIRPRRPGEAAVQHAADDIHVVPLPGWRLPIYRQLQFGLPAARRLQALWGEQRPDLVHIATEGPLGASALQVARRLGLPVASGFHTNFHAYSRYYGFRWLTAPINAWLRHFHRRCDVTLVPTAALAARLAADGFGRTEVMSRGIDTTLFHPGRREAELRADWGVSDDTPVVLGVGRLAPEKNWGLAVRAFHAIRAAVPQARMVIAGEGPEHERLRAALPDALFCGELPPTRLAACYASADLFLFPSLTETFGNVTLEAMASGVAVLAYACAAAGEVIESECNGLTVAPADETAFVAAAVRLAADADLRRRLGEAAAGSVQARGWDAVVLSVESTYFDLLLPQEVGNEHTTAVAGADRAPE